MANTNLAGIFYFKGDGSLRNSGVEIISGAMPAKQMIPAIGWLYKLMNKQKQPLDFSWRTSIHIHQNVRNLTESEFMKFVLLYLLFEKDLFIYCDVKRREGVFCVPLMECDTFLEAFFLEFKRTSRLKERNLDFGPLLKKWDKYAALGAFRLKDLGTLEFRHMPGTNDLKKVIGWICLIDRLFQASKEYKFADLIKDIVNMNTLSNYAGIREKVFQEYCCLFPFFLKENLIDGVVKIKENMFYTPVKRLVSKKTGTGLTTFLSKLEDRKKKNLGQNQEKLRDLYFEGYNGLEEQLIQPIEDHDPGADDFEEEEDNEDPQEVQIAPSFQPTTPLSEQYLGSISAAVQVLANLQNNAQAVTMLTPPQYVYATTGTNVSWDEITEYTSPTVPPSSSDEPF